MFIILTHKNGRKISVDANRVVYCDDQGTIDASSVWLRMDDGSNQCIKESQEEFALAANKVRK